mgnify:CR=1 FL=1
MTNKCIIPKKAVRHMSHRFLCVYKYRLNGNVGVIFLQGQGEPSILFHLLCMIYLNQNSN